MENKKAIPGNNKALLENMEATLKIKYILLKGTLTCGQGHLQPHSPLWMIIFIFR